MYSKNILAIAVAALLTLMVVGCKTNSDNGGDSTDSNGATAKVFTVKVAFVGDPAIGKIIEKQWKASGHSIELKVVAETDLIDAQKMNLLDFDVVIYPPNMLGTLVAQDCLESLSNDQLDGDELRPADILRIHRQDLVTYGGKTWGVSLGGPTFSLIYRADVFDQLELQVPQTWEQYEKVVNKLAEHDGKLKNEKGEALPTTVIEPLVENWAGKLLLLRTASAMCQRGQMENIMKLDDAKPLINTPPYVRSLQSLQSCFGGNKAGSGSTPIEAFKKIASGQAAMAITWPSATVKLKNVNEHLNVADVPASKELFDVIRMSWVPRSDTKTQAVLLGFDGKMASIIARARHKEGAEHFISWVASPESAGKIWTRSPHCSISRGSQISKPYSWCGQNVPRQVGDGYARLIKNVNANGLVMHCLRLPGQNEYMRVLDQAVLDCIRNGKDAQEALNAAAKQWEAITEKRGRDSQAKENRRSSGLTN